MPPHQSRSEPRRTRLPAFEPPLTEADAFRVQDEVTEAFTTALREGRCRPQSRRGSSLPQHAAVLEPLAGPWNVEALFVLYLEGPSRFSALKRALGGISSRVLTDKLRHLADAGLVEREATGRAVAYRLSADGEVVARHLHPIVFYLRNRAALRRPAKPPPPGKGAA